MLFVTQNPQINKSNWNELEPVEYFSISFDFSKLGTFK